MTRERPFVSGVCVLLALALLAPLSGCHDRAADDRGRDDRGDVAEPAPANTDAAAPAGEVAALASLLAHAASSSTLDDSQRRALEQAMERMLQPAAAVCEGCRTTVSYVDEAGGADYFRCGVRSADDELMADLEVYHRPDLAADAAKAWAQTALAGHPASGVDGERWFVWPGRFEIRAFGRADSLRAERRLEDLLASLPLDSLAKL